MSRRGASKVAATCARMCCSRRSRPAARCRRTVQMGRIDVQGRLTNSRLLDTRPVVQLAQQAQLSFQMWPGLSAAADRRGDDSASAPAISPAIQTQTQTRGRRPMASDAEIDELLTKGYKRREAEA